MELILHIIGGIIVFTPLVMYILAIWGLLDCYDNNGRQDDDDDDDPSDSRTRSSKRRRASSRSRTGSGSSDS